MLSWYYLVNLLKWCLNFFTVFSFEIQTLPLLAHFYFNIKKLVYILESNIVRDVRTSNATYKTHIFCRLLNYIHILLYFIVEIHNRNFRGKM